MSNKPRELKPLTWYKKLATSEGRFEAGSFLVEGTRATEQIIHNYHDAIVEILTTDKPLPEQEQFNTRIITEKQLHSISSLKTSQGLIAVVRMPRYSGEGALPDNTGKNILLLEDIQDPGNVGTLIRTAVAFGFEGIILSAKCADPFAPKSVQATAGTILSLWIRRTADYLDLIKSLKQKGKPIIVADTNGTTNPEILTSTKNLVLALGSEAHGPSKPLLELSDYQLQIPINSKKAESLNVAACGAICMYLSTVKR